MLLCAALDTDVLLAVFGLPAQLLDEEELLLLCLRCCCCGCCCFTRRLLLRDDEEHVDEIEERGSMCCGDAKYELLVSLWASFDVSAKGCGGASAVVFVLLEE